MFLWINRKVNELIGSLDSHIFCGLFISVLSITACIVLKFGKDLEGSSLSLNKFLYVHLRGGIVGNNVKTRNKR
jgi:hypothetical protein